MSIAVLFDLYESFHGSKSTRVKKNKEEELLERIKEQQEGDTVEGERLEEESEWHKVIRASDWDRLDELLQEYDFKLYKRKDEKPKRQLKVVKAMKFVKDMVFPSPDDDPEQLPLSPLLGCDTAGQTPLHLACYGSYDAPDKLTRRLIFAERQAAAVADDVGQLPLHVAARNQRSNAILDRLMRAFIPGIQRLDHMGKTALCYALEGVKQSKLETWYDDNRCDWSGTSTDNEKAYWNSPRCPEEKEWQERQEAVWDRVRFILLTYSTRRKVLVDEEKHIILEVLNWAAPSSVIELALFASQAVIKTDPAIASTALGIFMRRNYPIKNLNHLLHHFPVHNATIMETTRKIFRILWNIGCKPPPKDDRINYSQVIELHDNAAQGQGGQTDDASDQGNGSSLYSTVSGNTSSMDESTAVYKPTTRQCKEWWDKIVYLLDLCKDEDERDDSVNPCDNSQLLKAALKDYPTTTRRESTTNTERLEQDYHEFLERQHFLHTTFCNRFDAPAPPALQQLLRYMLLTNATKPSLPWNVQNRKTKRSHIALDVMKLSAPAPIVEVVLYGSQPVFKSDPLLAQDTLGLLMKRQVRARINMRYLLKRHLNEINNKNQKSSSDDGSSDDESSTDSKTGIQNKGHGNGIAKDGKSKDLKESKENSDTEEAIPYRAEMEKHALDKSYSPSLRCKEWWDKIICLLKLCGHGNDAEIKKRFDPKNHMLHAALSNCDTPPSLIQLLMALNPKSITLRDPGSDQLLIHLICRSWKYNLFPACKRIGIDHDMIEPPMEQVLRIILASDQSLIRKRHEDRLPIHHAIATAKSLEFIQILLSYDTPRVLACRDPQSMLYPFQLAALTVMNKNSALWAAEKYSKEEWKELGPEKRAEAVADVIAEQDLDQLSVIYHLLREFPSAVMPATIVRKPADFRDSKGRGMISAHYLNFFYKKEKKEAADEDEVDGSESGSNPKLVDATSKSTRSLFAFYSDWQLHKENMDMLLQAIKTGVIPPEMDSWYQKLKFWIWYCYPKELQGRIPPKKDEYLIHAAIVNQDTPPLVLDLLIATIPVGPSLPAPLPRARVDRANDFPLHMAAKALPYKAQEYEVSYDKKFLETLVRAHPRAVTVRAYQGYNSLKTLEGGFPLELAMAAGKSWEDCEALVKGIPRDGDPLYELDLASTAAWILDSSKVPEEVIDENEKTDSRPKISKEDDGDNDNDGEDEERSKEQEEEKYKQFESGKIIKRRHSLSGAISLAREGDEERERKKKSNLEKIARKFKLIASGQAFAQGLSTRSLENKGGGSRRNLLRVVSSKNITSSRNFSWDSLSVRGLSRESSTRSLGQASSSKSFNRESLGSIVFQKPQSSPNLFKSSSSKNLSKGGSSKRNLLRGPWTSTKNLV